MYWISFRKLLSPAILLLGAILLRQHVSSLHVAYLPLLQYAPYILLGVVLALCFYYNRSRLFAGALSSLTIYYLIQTQLQTTLTQQDTMLVFSLISVLHPLSLLLFMFMPERGLVNRYGLFFIIAIAFVVLLSAFVINYYPLPIALIFSKWMPVKPFSGLVLSLPGIVFYLLVVSIGLYRLFKYDDEFATMIVIIALFSCVILAKLDLANISAVMYSAASISLIMAMMGSSYNMAYRDELTGLLGRRALNDRMKGLAGQYVIAMMDIDHFKKFNDTHGHDVGDDVLKMVARQIASVKGGGTAYRYGGEEFCVIFAGKDIEYCQPYLEDVRLDVQNYFMTVRDNSQRPKSTQTATQRRGRRGKSRNELSVSVTISIGIAEPDDKRTKVEGVLKAADTALYKAKKKGRNCLAY